MDRKEDKEREPGSLPCSRKGSLRKKGRLHRNILSADFDALFEWAKEREKEECTQSLHASIPVLTKSCDENEPSRVPHNSRVSLDPGSLDPVCSKTNYLAPLQDSKKRHHHSSQCLVTSAEVKPKSSGSLTSLSSSVEKEHVYNFPSGSQTRVISGDKPGMQPVRMYSLTPKGLVRINPSPNSARRRKGTALKCDVWVKYGSSGDSHVIEYRVMLLGAYGVGKRALLHDFLVPQDSFGYCPDEDEDGEKSVSILLDGEESTLEFVDLSDEEISKFISAEQIDAYVVVYSVEDRRSFETAIDRLYEIRQEDGREVAVILVANKTDLVRTRVIFEEEGRAAANTYDSKYIEVSAAIDHKIDELLVGILKQIRLIKELRGTKHHHHRRNSGSEQKDSDKKFCCPLRAKNTVMERLFGKTRRGAKSCENLYVL